jgi:hypothetical protein
LASTSTALGKVLVPRMLTADTRWARVGARLAGQHGRDRAAVAPHARDQLAEGNSAHGRVDERDRVLLVRDGGGQRTVGRPPGGGAEKLAQRHPVQPLVDGGKEGRVGEGPDGQLLDLPGLSGQRLARLAGGVVRELVRFAGQPIVGGPVEKDAGGVSAPEQEHRGTDTEKTRGQHAAANIDRNAKLMKNVALRAVQGRTTLRARSPISFGARARS